MGLGRNNSVSGLHPALTCVMQRYALFRCCVLLTFFAFMPDAFAESIPAISSEQVVSDTQTSYYTDGGGLNHYPHSSYYASPLEFCVGYSAQLRALSGTNQLPYSLYKNSSCLGVLEANKYAIISCTKCPSQYVSYLIRHGACATGSVWNGTDCVKTIYSCPATGGWTLSSDQQSCTRPDCPAGYDRDPNTGACLAPCLAGQERNLSTMQCETSCPSPLIRTEGNTCNCPAPLTLTDDNACVGSEDKNLGNQDCRNTPSASPVLE